MHQKWGTVKIDRWWDVSYRSYGSRGRKPDFYTYFGATRVISVRKILAIPQELYVPSPNCSFLDAETIAQIKGTPTEKLPGNFSSAAELLHAYSSAASGEARMRSFTSGRRMP